MNSTEILILALAVSGAANVFFVTLNIVQNDVTILTAFSAGAAALSFAILLALAVVERRWLNQST